MASDPPPLSPSHPRLGLGASLFRDRPVSATVIQTTNICWRPARGCHRGLGGGLGYASTSPAQAPVAFPSSN
jgi:hypothetical protein